jgi:hypothetical protein
LLFHPLNVVEENTARFHLNSANIRSALDRVNHRGGDLWNGHISDRPADYDYLPNVARRMTHPEEPTVSERQTMADDRIELARLRDCLRNCADELESEINARYGIPVHPAQKSRYERDLSTVVEARAIFSAPATPSEGLVEKACASCGGEGRHPYIDPDNYVTCFTCKGTGKALSTPATSRPWQESGYYEPLYPAASPPPVVPEEVMQTAVATMSRTADKLRHLTRAVLTDGLRELAHFIVGLGKEGAEAAEAKLATLSQQIDDAKLYQTIKSQIERREFQYRVEKSADGFEPQMLYTLGRLDGFAWFPLTANGYWADPDAFTDGEIKIRSVFQTKENAERAIVCAKRINGEKLISAVSPARPPQVAELIAQAKEAAEFVENHRDIPIWLASTFDRLATALAAQGDGG